MKNSKKIQMQFTKEVNAFFKSLGFVMVEEGERYEMKIDTKIGFFYITTHEDNSRMFSVYGNFMQYPDKAKEKFNHWKQNIHSVQPLVPALMDIMEFYTNILKIANA